MDNSASRYVINPSFRLRTAYLSVEWHQVDAPTLHAEGAIVMKGRATHEDADGKTDLMCHYTGAQVDLIYHSDTDFDSASLQKWLREVMGRIITHRARTVLPERVRYWENAKNLHGNGVVVEPLRKNVLGMCTGDNVIHLPPFLVIFKQEWMDGVILHEMAHFRHKHHKKPFWDFLSVLMGSDARKADAKTDIALSPYFDYYRYLTS